MSRPFKSIEAQIVTLRERGMIVDDNASNILLIEGYYSLVNGYKDFFIDREKSQSTPHETYIAGTNLNDLHQLSNFDRELRRTAFFYISKAESTCKTVLIYKFCQKFSDTDAYLSALNYAEQSEYMLGESRYEDDISTLLEILKFNACDKKKANDAILHYRENHKGVPLWVLGTSLTFGNVLHFYTLQKQSFQNEICKTLTEINCGNKLTSRNLRKYLDTLCCFRNLCAHGSRLFCERVGPKKNYSLNDVEKSLRFILPPYEVDQYILEVKGLVEKYSDSPRISATLKNVVGNC